MTEIAEPEISGIYQKYEAVGNDQDKRREALSGKEQQIQRAAESGNPAAQFLYGKILNEGWGVTKDPEEAVRWYRKLAEQGDASAQINLGVMYAKGEGVRKDPAEAVRWFRKSAEQGNAWGQINLGVMYAKGEGVARDFAEAVKWLQKSLEDKDLDPKLAEVAKNALRAPELAQFAIQTRSNELLDKMVERVKDPESGKDGGPSTRDVIRVINGGQADNIYGNASVLFSAFAQGMAQGMGSVEEIRRGKVLTSLISSQIPMGTPVFPIRIIFSTQIGSPQQDMYFFKDEFGDWSGIPKE